MNRTVRLGVNIDHVATLRNARGGAHPDPLRAAEAAFAAGADLITAHLREDRRHIRDDDVIRLGRDLAAPLNLELAANPDMARLALAFRPHAVCLVPERRAERTTEGGLDAAGSRRVLAEVVPPLVEAGIIVALFIEPEPAQVEAARAVGATAIELHTGRYSDLAGAAQDAELARLAAAAAAAAALGLDCHAGHGLNFANVGPVAALPQVTELNIGHFLVGEAVFTGLDAAIRTMRRLILRHAGAA